jgi:hypothetical protein
MERVFLLNAHQQVGQSLPTPLVPKLAAWLLRKLGGRVVLADEELHEVEACNLQTTIQRDGTVVCVDHQLAKPGPEF